MRRLGTAATKLDDDQKKEIAEIRSFYKAKLAEREILHHSDLRKTQNEVDFESIAKIEEHYREDRAKMMATMESKVNAVKRRNTR